MTAQVVIDASVAVAVLLDEANSEAARRLLRASARDQVAVVAPHLFGYEVTNALHRRVDRGLLSSEAALGLLRRLETFGIEQRQPPDFHERAMQLANELAQRAAYDAHYLVLAQSLNCEFWTGDQRFYAAARRFSNNVRWIGDFDLAE